MRLWLCFDAHRTDNQVWAIRHGNQWHRAKSVDARIPMQTVYRGPQAKQPKAYLVGQAQRVTINGGEAIIQ